METPSRAWTDLPPRPSKVWETFLIDTPELGLTNAPGPKAGPGAFANAVTVLEVTLYLPT
jgi:hypothetical protein